MGEMLSRVTCKLVFKRLYMDKRRNDTGDKREKKI